MIHINNEPGGAVLKVNTDALEFRYHLDSAEYDICFTGAQGAQTTGIGCWFERQNEQIHHKSLSQSKPELASQMIADAFGRSAKVTVLRHYGSIDVVQHFQITEEQRYMLLWLEISGRDFVQSARMAPLVATGDVFSLKNAKSPRFLSVPYDNDKWVRYKAQEMQECPVSYELTAVYDDDKRHGYVLGSVTHDAWKSGIKTHGGYDSLSMLTLYGGVADTNTRDEGVPHGAVRGVSVSSPKFLVGYYDDFRQGLVDYGKANALVCPALPWNGGVIFGWNSWACMASKIDIEAFMATSDALETLRVHGYENNGQVYINFDAFWNHMPAGDIRKAVETAHGRGQKIGAYFTPFACWASDLNQTVENTGGKYTYRDLILRDHNGNPLQRIAGGAPIDPTHPGNLQRVQAMMDYIVDSGFDYIKFDFMSHGACEGEHTLHTVRTGMQAYNYGLKHLLSFVSPEKTGRDIFIDFSIAPLFPHQYAHARRVSCDVFGQNRDSEYMLNSLTYAFWQNGTIYAYTDPDHTCLYKSVWQGVTTLNEARTRLHASVIGGTVMLLGDDYRREEALARTLSLISEPLLAIARRGQAFHPVYTATLDRASAAFISEDERDIYLAVFNFNSEPATFTLPAQRLGIAADTVFYTLDGRVAYEDPEYAVTLDGHDSVILKARKRDVSWPLM